MTLQYSTLSVNQSTQTDPIAPIDKTVELYNELYLKIRKNTQDIKNNERETDKELQDIVKDIYDEMYNTLKDQIMDEVKELINSVKDDMVDLKAEIINEIN